MENITVNHPSVKESGDTFIFEQKLPIVPGNEGMGLFFYWGEFGKAEIHFFISPNDKTWFALKNPNSEKPRPWVIKKTQFYSGYDYADLPFMNNTKLKIKIINIDNSTHLNYAMR